MRSTRQQARFAGLLYALMLVTGLPGLIFIPKVLFVYGDAAATAAHIRASEPLLRLGIASELCHQVVFLYLGLALYRLFESVNRSAAVQLVLLVAMSVPIMFLNAMNELAALVILGAPPFLATFSRAQLDSLAYLFLRIHGQGFGVVWVFWSLWLVPFGILVLRSGFLPRILGVLLLLAAAGDMATAVTSLFPMKLATVIDPIARGLAPGELVTAIWLLAFGAREAPARIEAVAA